MKNFRRKNSSLKLIVFLIALLCTTLGYAIFMQELIINGSVTGSATFKVYFAEAWIKHSSLEEDHTDTPNGKDEAEIGSGTVNINTSQGADRVRFNVTLNNPGDKVLIGTRIKNESSMRVKLNDFLVTKSIDIPDINLDYIPLNPTTEKLDSNGECIYEFVVGWNENSTEQNSGPVTFDIELDYEQDPSPDPTPPSPSHDHGEGELHTINFDANGGTVSPTFKQITEGQTYGVLPTPRRPDYNFVGWFTALENGTQVNASDTVSVTGDITLYAIWNYVGHTMSAIARVEPTCTEVGNIAYYKCTDCNRLYSDEEGTTEITDIEIPALGHNITQEARVEPTCTEEGNIAHYKCTRCNKTFSDNEGATEIEDVEIPALGHILTHVEGVAATCTEAGNVEYYQCSRCNKLYSDSGATTEIADATIPALGHDYNDEDWEVTTAPLCDVAGVETRLCRRNCGTYETRTITALGHDFAEEYTIDVEPTCTEAGEKSRHCSRCVARTDITAIPANGHTAGEYTVTTAAGCETTGVETATCTVCGSPVTRSVSALGHDYTSTASTAYKASNATCTAAATYYKTCTRCGNPGTATFSNGNALGHSLTKTARVEATCTANGNIEYYTCSRCSKKFSDSAGNTEVTNITITKLGHSYSNTKTASVCQTCSRCGNTTSHSSWTKNASSSTCRTCNTCGYVDTAHSYGGWTTTTSPTCSSTGSRYRTCSDCSYKQTGTLSKVDHDYTGTMSSSCKYCGNKTVCCKWCNKCYVCKKNYKTGT